MRILVTGATGFIGRRLLPLLSDHEVLCLVREARALPTLPFAAPLVGELGMPDLWAAEVDDFRPQWCVHLAWEGLPDYSPTYCRANLEAGLGLIGKLVRAKTERVIVAGTCWEYGAVNGPVSESHVPADVSIFAATKTVLQGELRSAAEGAAMEYRWARIFFAYGTGQRSNSLIPLCHAAYASGRAPEVKAPRVAQDFVHVDDVAAGLRALTECDAPSGIYNIGTGSPTSVGEVVNNVAAHFGAAPPYPDARYDTGFWADMTKTEAATGWRAKVSIDEGVARTLRELDRGVA